MIYYHCRCEAADGLTGDVGSGTFIATGNELHLRNVILYLHAQILRLLDHSRRKLSLNRLPDNNTDLWFYPFL